MLSFIRYKGSTPFLSFYIGISFSGRTTDFDSVNVGSNPAIPVYENILILDSYPSGLRGCIGNAIARLFVARVRIPYCLFSPLLYIID